ncbi:flagellar biosynthesis protein FlgD [Shewanella sp.]|nr:flagellar biosynthesis protein FlgD [Shewanella sp.]
MDVTSTNNLTSLTSTDNTVTASANDASAIKNEFMTLMIAQIQNQDPTNPIEGAEYVAQLAQFSQVESLEQMRANQSSQMVMMENLGVVQSAHLVGKNAMVPASEFTLADSPLEGKVFLGSATESLSVDLIDKSGEVVHTIELGSQAAGDIAFNIDPAAHGLAPGDYNLVARTTNGEDTETADTFIQAEIEKIHFVSASGVMMAELGNGLGTLSVLEISEVS